MFDSVPNIHLTPALSDRSSHIEFLRLCKPMIDLLDLIDLASYKTAPAKFIGCSKTQLNQGSSFTIAYYIKSFILQAYIWQVMSSRYVCIYLNTLMI